MGKERAERGADGDVGSHQVLSADVYSTSQLLLCSAFILLRKSAFCPCFRSGFVFGAHAPQGRKRREFGQARERRMIYLPAFSSPLPKTAMSHVSLGNRCLVVSSGTRVFFIFSQNSDFTPTSQKKGMGNLRGDGQAANHFNLREKRSGVLLVNKVADRLSVTILDLVPSSRASHKLLAASCCYKEQSPTSTIIDSEHHRLSAQALPACVETLWGSTQIIRLHTHTLQAH